jgi:hypothetical protein
MKYWYIIALILISILSSQTASAQFLESNHKPVKGRITESRVKPVISPGDELRLFSKHMYLGIGSSAIGTGLLMGSYYVPDSFSRDGSANKVMFATGCVFSLVGLIFTIESYHHISKAGILLNENGIGLSVPINSQ